MGELWLEKFTKRRRSREMRLKKKVDNLAALILDRSDSIEEALKILIGRAEIIETLREIIKDLREERKELLDRLMSRDFETFKTYTETGRTETMGEDIPPEEDVDMAGEIFNVSEMKV